MNLATSSKSSKDKRENEDYILKLLQRKLPQNATADLENSLQSNFVFRSIVPKKKKETKKKKQFLTRKERTKLNILKLPKANWKYNDLTGMRQLWKEYMRNNLNIYKTIPTIEDSNWNNFNVTLGKSEFIGADLKVVRSKVVNQVGMTGTVVLETKATFQIVTLKDELKILLKKPSVFLFTLDDIKFTIFGKHMMVRPSERSVKKLKQHFLPDL